VSLGRSAGLSQFTLLLNGKGLKGEGCQRQGEGSSVGQDEMKTEHIVL